ncbi:MAG: hypothetical protein HZA90_04925 [Verrucomicrobia bacterium]|nr:hypothetical protein [Verrucomicrobiota bacterium]
MKAFTIFTSFALLASGSACFAQLPVLKRSDVVFMYQAERQTYQDYGATVLAWGGRPTAKSLEAARGLKFFGSVGMVTEFNRYYERFPRTYEQGLCRNLEGQPFKVPWLTDHQHKGVPYWWCCTRQPLFRQYLSERVADTVKAGADGVHIDDHLGTAGGMFAGGCFCDRCVKEFPAFLAALPADELTRLGVTNSANFNFRDVVRAWLAEKSGRQASQHPLYPKFRVYQFRGAAAFMMELRALAAKTAGLPVPMSANAGLLWGPHLSDYQALDGFSAEIDHHAAARRFSDSPLVAYRLADAVGRPLVSTASGGDWAFIKEQNLPGLVQGWMALSYAAGHGLMAPHHQWCYTPQKGTHWYDGPKEKFAPLCQFIRRNAALLDGYDNHADLTVAFSQRTFDRRASRVIGACNMLAAANLSYRIALGSDDIVDHPLPAESIGRGARLLVLESKDFSAADQQVLATAQPAQRFDNVEHALTNVSAAVRVESPAEVRALPRVKPGSAVIHLVNWDYDAARDGAPPATNVRLKLDLPALGVAGAKEARLVTLDGSTRVLPVQAGAVTVPELVLWALLEVKGN